MKQGWIKLQRSLLDWEWYDDINTKILFLHCLLRANHSEKQWRGITIKRGQFYTSLETLSNETGLSTQKLRTAILKLESTGEITSNQHAKARMITVVNYKTYQSDNKADNKEVTNNQQGSNKEVTTNKNEKNIKNEKNVNKFTPPSEGDFIQYLLEEMPKINPEWTSDRINRAACQQFETYVEDGWKDGFGKAIKNWKTKAKNCLTHKKPYSYGKATGTEAPPKKQYGKL